MPLFMPSFGPKAGATKNAAAGHLTPNDQFNGKAESSMALCVQIHRTFANEMPRTMGGAFGERKEAAEQFDRLAITCSGLLIKFRQPKCYGKVFYYRVEPSRQTGTRPLRFSLWVSD